MAASRTGVAPAVRSRGGRSLVRAKQASIGGSGSRPSSSEVASIERLTRSSTCAKSRDSVETLRSSTRSMTSLRSSSLTASASSRIDVGVRSLRLRCAGCGDGASLRARSRIAVIGRGRARRRIGRRIGRLDEHLVRLRGEEAADAALADAVRPRRCARSGPTSARTRSRRSSRTGPSNCRWLAKVHHRDRVELELRAELRVGEDREPRAPRPAAAGATRRAAGSSRRARARCPSSRPPARCARPRSPVARRPAGRARGRCRGRWCAALRRASAR